MSSRVEISEWAEASDPIWKLEIVPAPQDDSQSILISSSELNVLAEKIKELKEWKKI